MFFELMAASFQGVMEVFLVGILGYLAVAGLTGGKVLLDQITGLVIRLALPCLVFSTMVTSFDPGDLTHWWVFPLISVCINVSGALLAGLYLTIDRTVRYRGEFMALVAFQNSIFLPLAFAPVLFGPDELPKFLNLLFLFNLVNIPLFFTLGVWLVNRTAGISLTLKDFLNPPVVATAVSFLFILTGLSSVVPGWLLRPLDTVGALTTPLSMLFVGGIIVTTLPRAKPADWLEPLKIMGLKCFIMPLIASLLVLVFRPPEYVALFMILHAVMPSALLVALVAPDEGVNQASIAGAILLTSLVSILTIPLFMGFYGSLYG